MTRTVRALLEYAVGRFERAGLAYGHGTTNAVDEAAWLILRALGRAPGDIGPLLDLPVDDAQWNAARALIDRRVRTRKPAAYLLHEAWLGPHRFYVDERVIVPRSFIAEWLMKNRGQSTVFEQQSAVAASENRGLSPVFRVLDLCTGSGCLAILAALAFPGAEVDAADLSEDALAVAKVNVKAYGLSKRVRLVKSDLFGALEGRRYDLIVSNPPYVKAASMRALPEEYRKEPAMALASGTDGLEHTRRILADAPRHLAPGGRLVVEIGHNRKALERSYPKLPFEWPAAAGGTGYFFVLPREALRVPML